jgi:hypothetical protein
LFAGFDISLRLQRFASRNNDSPDASPHHHIRSNIADGADGTVAEITDSKRQFEDKYHSSAYKQMTAKWSSWEIRCVDMRRDRALTSAS